MSTSATNESLLVQTNQPPFDDLSLVQAHVKLVNSITCWTDIGLLSDENNKNLLILLLNDNKPVSILRICISVDESMSAIQSLNSFNGAIYLGFYQGNNLKEQEVRSMATISEIWSSIHDQTTTLSIDELKVFFNRLETESKENGRGNDFCVETKRQVLQFSHGRCMFDGCGVNLGIDELTGYEGNFSYLAHNVASSENGERGGAVISKKLSDEPSNVLLLCDKHHRLIDKVAAADFTAIRLSIMRNKFKSNADKLLEGLSFEPLPTYAVLWPVGGNVIAAPTDLQIGQALSVIQARAERQIQVISDNNELLLEMNLNDAWKLMPRMIEHAASKILQQTHNQQHRAALFAFGLMPPLIGLGAKIGNKAEIIPMLRFRDSGTWSWPIEQPRSNIIEVNIDKELSKDDEEVIVSISLTAKPSQFDEYVKISGLKHVEVIASEGNMGNGCISHPSEGKEFMNDIHKLLHRLVSDYGVRKVHLLPCASNTACVFLGKAIDNHHPEIVVYDFVGKSMAPKLLIKPSIDGVEISAV
ncbi:MAG: hypothetical protein ACI82Q_003146 [Nonlabens sp.]|jgi:hypothetical protein